MGPTHLDPKITGQMKTWGGNYDSTVGDNHETCADHIDPKIDSKSITLNKELDPNRAKPRNMNPGVDMGFLAKANPQTDSTGHGKLSRSNKD